MRQANHKVLISLAATVAIGAAGAAVMARGPSDRQDDHERSSGRPAKNVILFIGDGMSNAHRVAARLLSRGMTEGKARGKLAMDEMPHMALVATAGVDSIITDSANSASAYSTGHKSSTNAMGVYADRTRDPFDDPRVETISSLAKRKLGLAIGVVTNTEVEDATPAAMICAHPAAGGIRQHRRAIF